MSDERVAASAEVRAEYGQLRSALQQLYAKIGALESDKSEHELVLVQLRELPGDRRAWIQIGGALCEQNVEKTIPILAGNLQSATESITKLTEELQSTERRIAELSSKYILQDATPAQGAPAGSPSSSSTPASASQATGLLA